MGQFRTYCLHFTNISFFSEDESVSAGDSEEDGSGSAGDSEEDGSESVGDSEDEPDPQVQEVCVEMTAFPIAPR